MICDEKRIKVISERECFECSYLEHGSSAEVLICLHGIQGSKTTFSNWIGSSLLQNARVIALDIPGFGNSKVFDSSSYDLESQTERVVSFLDALGLKKVYIFGHSLGGMLGTLLLEAIPDRINALICSEGNLTLHDCGESRRVASMTFDEFQRKLFSSIQMKGVNIEAKVFYETACSIVEISRSERLLQLIQQSCVPVLFLKGAESHFVTYPQGKTVKVVTIPRKNHLGLAGCHELLVELVRFLKEIR